MFIRGLEIPSAKVRKETRRHNCSLLGVRRPPGKVLEQIRVCTPPGFVQNLIGASGSLLGTLQTQTSIPRLTRSVQDLVRIATRNLPSLQFMNSLDSNGKVSVTAAVQAYSNS